MCTIAPLASFVSERMGGAVPAERYVHLDLSAEVGAAKRAAGSDVVPLGALRRGGARHRALLFKLLADRCGLPCELHAGRWAGGAHARHGWAGGSGG